MRFLLLALAVVLTAFIAALTIVDINRHGFSWLDAMALLIVLLFGTGLIGALLQRPRR